MPTTSLSSIRNRVARLREMTLLFCSALVRPHLKSYAPVLGSMVQEKNGHIEQVQ